MVRPSLKSQSITSADFDPRLPNEITKKALVTAIWRLYKVVIQRYQKSIDRIGTITILRPNFEGYSK